MAEYDYDMVVIGSGPAGQRAAVQAAKLGKRAAIVERHAEIGGVMVNTGTIPSKTLREAVMYLTGYRERGIYGESYSVKQDITMSDLMIRTNHVMHQNTDTLRHQLLTEQGGPDFGRSVVHRLPHVRPRDSGTGGAIVPSRQTRSWWQSERRQRGLKEFRWTGSASC